MIDVSFLILVFHAPSFRLGLRAQKNGRWSSKTMGLKDEVPYFPTSPCVANKNGDVAHIPCWTCYLQGDGIWYDMIIMESQKSWKFTSNSDSIMIKWWFNSEWWMVSWNSDQGTNFSPFSSQSGSKPPCRRKPWGYESSWWGCSIGCSGVYIYIYIYMYM